MSDQYNPNEGELVPAGRRDLSPVVAANPLVGRGLADLESGRLKMSEETRLRFEQALFHGARDPEMAIGLLDEIIRLHPKHAFAYYIRGLAWLQKDRSGSDHEACDMAIKDFDEAIRIEPDNTNVFEARGKAWYHKGQFDQAIKDFSETIRVHSACPVGDWHDERLEADYCSSTAETYCWRGQALYCN